MHIQSLPIKYLKFLICILLNFIVLFFVVGEFGFAQETPAFPGAEGFGKYSEGGRGGKVIKVTNLENGGPGSLRNALEAKGPRTVVFETGGIIDLETPIEITNPNITIAGQTAPGGGIMIRGNGIKIHTNNVIIRYLRIRPGDVSFGPENNWNSVDAITIGSSNINSGVHDIIIDHCSLSWAIDENLDIWNQGKNITIQNSIIAEGLKHSKHPADYAHSMGMLIGGKNVHNITIYNNIFAHNNSRNPLIKSGGVYDLRGNVIYNSGNRALYFDTSPRMKRDFQKVNYIANTVIEGPSSSYPEPIVMRESNLSVLELYLEDNRTITTGREQRITTGNIKVFRGTSDHESISSMVGSQIHSVPYEIPKRSSVRAYNYVLENAGAVLPERDNVDTRIVSEVKKREGKIINSQNTVGSWPVLEEGIAPTDSDDDGMNDYWEEQHGLNPNKPDDHLDPDEDGYTNIEEYINGTDPKGTGTASSNDVGSFFQSSNGEDASIEFQQNYPNPFNSRTTIQFSVNQSSPVNLEVYNMAGKKVTTLINSRLFPGEYELFWEVRDRASGVYLLRLSTPSTQKVMKSTIIK